MFLLSPLAVITNREREAMRDEAQNYIAHIKELEEKLQNVIEQQSE